MNVGVLLMGDVQSNSLSKNRFGNSEIEIENETLEKEKKKKGKMSIFPVEEASRFKSTKYILKK